MYPYLFPSLFLFLILFPSQGRYRCQPRYQIYLPSWAATSRPLRSSRLPTRPNADAVSHLSQATPASEQGIGLKDPCNQTLHCLSRPPSSQCSPISSSTTVLALPSPLKPLHLIASLSPFFIKASAPVLASVFPISMYLDFGPSLPRQLIVAQVLPQFFNRLLPLSSLFLSSSFQEPTKKSSALHIHPITR